ncbi:MAG TPA: type II secretion system protein [Mesotoga infera]|uniref:Type II secretion system protein n=1 Tax=Mesotoga infera TaxID=1236046 RepID=A0A7C1GUE1_9BACT|nr:type II secretion system protein [Mesotoga infera]
MDRVVEVKRRKIGMTLVELTVVMIVFTIVLSSVLLMFTDLIRRSNIALGEVERYSELFKVDSIIQAELSKAGPNVEKITLVKESEEGPARGLRYMVSLPFVRVKVTKQFYINEGRLFIWEKQSAQGDFPVDSTADLIEPLDSAENIIFSSSSFDHVDLEFESVNGGSVLYSIMLSSPDGTRPHRSSVRLINVK